MNSFQSQFPIPYCTTVNSEKSSLIFQVKSSYYVVYEDTGEYLSSFFNEMKISKFVDFFDDAAYKWYEGFIVDKMQGMILVSQLSRIVRM